MKMPENLRQISDIIPRQKINSESDTTRETLRNIANQKSMIITLFLSTRNQQLQIKSFIEPLYYTDVCHEFVNVLSTRYCARAT